MAATTVVWGGFPALKVTWPVNSLYSLVEELYGQPLAVVGLLEQVFITLLVLRAVHRLLKSDFSLKNAVASVGIWIVSWLPGGAAEIARQREETLKMLDENINGTHGKELQPTRVYMPKQGADPDELWDHLTKLHESEGKKVVSGKAFGGMYAVKEHGKFLNKVYSLFSSSNALYADLFPCARKFEVELVSMSIDMMQGDGECCGSVTSGGTESIVMAVKACREYGRVVKGITEPEMILAESAHPAFDKAAHYFGIRIVRIPVRNDLRMDVAKAKRAISSNTIMMVGSAPGFPHGMIDDIEQLAPYCKSRGVPFHTDSCLGGFLVPWYKRMGFIDRNFDFSVDGVTSISADVHKYGMANKGCSVILYRSHELRRHQFFVSTEWSGGLYCSPSFNGSRSGALIAQAWASVMLLGQSGYMKGAEQMAKMHQTLRVGLAEIEGLFVMGHPDACMVAFGSNELDIYAIAEAIEELGWECTRLHKPKCVHVATHARNSTPELVRQYLADVRKAVEAVRADPKRYASGMTPVYGMAATFPARGLISDLVKDYLDRLYTTAS